MKLFRISLLLFSVALLFSCVAERKDCPADRSLTLEFVYEYGGRDVFRDNVQMVNLFLFDANTGVLIDSETIGSVALNAFAGITFDNLPPGDYRVVAWGNAAQRTQFVANQGDHIDDTHVRHEGVVRSGETHSGDGDRLHFAPNLGGAEVFTVNVPQTGDVSATLPFSRAYIEIQVFLVGYDRYTQEVPPPIVEIGGASLHYNFERIPFGNITLRETTVYQENYEERPALAVFRTKLFDAADMTKELRVFSAEEGNPVRFTLENAELRSAIREYMRLNGIASLTSDRTPQRVIPITITFGRDVSVQVTVPEFEVIQTDPDVT
jgi:hypothetical protein